MSYESNKVISVVILTCNRKQMVEELVAELQKQTIIDRTEIIVVDNGSLDNNYLFETTGTVDKTIKLKNNIGCAGRNEGIKQAGTDYVVTLDDDVFPHRPEELEMVLRFFENTLDANVVNFKILFPESKELIPFNWYHPKDPSAFSDATFLTDYISEGAVAFRKASFECTGYYPEEFFLSHEGPDLACRFINAGYNIYYSGSVEVLHKCSKVQRVTWRNTYYDTRNYFWFLVRNYKFPALMWMILFRLVVTFLFAVSRGQIVWYCRAIRDSVAGLPLQIKNRKPLTDEALNKLREIRKDKVPIFKRAVKYIKNISIINKAYPNRV
ncbi:glycosyltransferase family 2 protein [Geobacter sulfurreducens]|uniref:glycosyltransferase family 2 protein n=1 Tax=Geobacter sulfurreducens TaxID=35554 RepID=UPI002CC7048E|nr:glycosyltransferase [Geobacter sulfurreducens]HML78023.1 glycosyltransferase [Geobacter sulfurreducens]